MSVGISMHERVAKTFKFDTITVLSQLTEWLCIQDAEEYAQGHYYVKDVAAAVRY